jgi:transposase
MKKYRVHLIEVEREKLRTLIISGKYKEKKLKRAQILLGADESEGGKNMSDEQIVLAYDTSPSTVERTRRRFIEDGFDIALHGKPRPVTARIKMDGDLEAHLVATACSEAPEGYERWTVKLLTEELIAKGYIAEISEETVRLTLKKTKLSLEKNNISS